jgi:signal transduction histidine kinase
MEYRAHQIGAKFSLKSSALGGTAVEIRIPLARGRSPISR